MKLDITPAEWGINFPEKLPYHRIVGGIFTDNPILVCGEIEEYHNAKAIVIAVNNTYHSGINPEAVPEMLAQLKNLVYNTLEVDRLPQALVKQLELTIQKATL